MSKPSPPAPLLPSTPSSTSPAERDPAKQTTSLFEARRLAPAPHDAPTGTVRRDIAPADHPHERTDHAPMPVVPEPALSENSPSLQSPPIVEVDQAAAPEDSQSSFEVDLPVFLRLLEDYNVAVPIVEPMPSTPAAVLTPPPDNDPPRLAFSPDQPAADAPAVEVPVQPLDPGVPTISPDPVSATLAVSPVPLVEAPGQEHNTVARSLIVDAAPTGEDAPLPDRADRLQTPAEPPPALPVDTATAPQETVDPASAEVQDLDGLPFVVEPAHDSAGPMVARESAIEPAATVPGVEAIAATPPAAIDGPVEVEPVVEQLTSLAPAEALPVMPAGMAPALWPVPLDPIAGTLAVAGCTITVQGDLAPLLQVVLGEGALLTFAKDALVWVADAPRIDDLPLPARDATDAVSPVEARVQAYGPGTLALTAGLACSVFPLLLASGAVLDVAPRALLACTRGVRLCGRWSQGMYLADRVQADRDALVLLRCPGQGYALTLPVGSWMTVHPDTLLSKDGSIAISLLHQYGAGKVPFRAYRLCGPGRAVLGMATLAW